MLRFLEQRNKIAKKLLPTEPKSIEGMELASPFRRFFAFTIDNFIICTIRWIIAMILIKIWLSKSFYVFASEYNKLISDGLADPNNMQDLFAYLRQHSFLYEVIVFILLLFFFGSLYWICLPLSRFGATFGKKMMKIKIVKEDGGSFDIKLAIFRYFTALIPWGFNIVFAIAAFSLQRNGLLAMVALLCASFWYEPTIFKRSRKAMHDIICQTRVVRNIVNK